MVDGWTSAVTSTFQWNIRAKRRATESSLLPRVYAKRTFIRNKLNWCALSLWCCSFFKLAPMHISPGQHRNTSRTLMAGTHTTLAKKKNHHRDSRWEERCSTCDIMLDQARSAQGKFDPRLSATFALRWSRLIEHDITRGTAFFSPRISMMVLFFGQGSRSSQSKHAL